MLYFIKIDRDSITKIQARANPSYISGRLISKPDGTVLRNLIQVNTTIGEPNYLFNYLEEEITCDRCCNTFPHNKLEGVEVGLVFLKNICPVCYSPNCCQIEWETIEAALGETDHE